MRDQAVFSKENCDPIVQSSTYPILQFQWGRVCCLFQPYDRWTQQELAKRAHISAITISRLERGEMQQVLAEIVARLTQVFRTSTDCLLGLKNEGDND